MWNRTGDRDCGSGTAKRGAAPPPAAARGPLDRRACPPRILIVEDEFVLALELEQLATDAGFAVCALASDAGAAVTMAELYRPDLVLMDVRLAGGTDGVAAATEIRSRLDIGSVFLTAHTDAATLRRAEAARPLAYLAKPFSPRELVLVLERVLHHPGRPH